MVSPQGEWIETHMRSVMSFVMNTWSPRKGSGLKRQTESQGGSAHAWSLRKGSGLKQTIDLRVEFRGNMVSPQGEWIETKTGPRKCPGTGMVSPQGEWIETGNQDRTYQNPGPWSPRKGSGLKRYVFRISWRHGNMISPQGEWIETCYVYRGGLKHGTWSPRKGSGLKQVGRSSHA